MKIAMDAGEMKVLRTRLHEASEAVGSAVPRMPGAGAFGPAVLAGAVASFETAMRREATDLREQWTMLDSGVRGAFDDMSDVETAITAAVEQISARLA